MNGSVEPQRAVRVIGRHVVDEQAGYALRGVPQAAQGPQVPFAREMFKQALLPILAG